MWILLLVTIALTAAAVLWWVTARDEKLRRARTGRYDIPDTPARLPLLHPSDRPPSDPHAPDVPPGRLPLLPPLPEPATPDTPGRTVLTPDGEMLLTAPPFRLRPGLFSHSQGRWVRALMRRLPPWVVVAPRVRLDTLLTPTTPDGRNPADWRRWRRRVRLRSVDALLCDARSWSPIVAIIFARSPSTRAIGGGKDSIADEVLAAAGLPLLRVTGSFKDDWPTLRPYIEQATLPSSHSDPAPGLSGDTWDSSAAVELLAEEDSADT